MLTIALDAIDFNGGNARGNGKVTLKYSRSEPGSAILALQRAAI
jgi:hypothetical protein